MNRYICCGISIEKTRCTSVVHCKFPAVGSLIYSPARCVQAREKAEAAERARAEALAEKKRRAEEMEKIRIQEVISQI